VTHCTLCVLRCAGLKFTDWVPGQMEIQHVNAKSQAARHPEIEVGLVLVAVGGTEVAGMGYEAVLDVIRAHAERPLTLRFNKLADVVASFEKPGSLGMKFGTRKGSPGQVEIAGIQPGSFAAEAGLVPGLILMRVGAIDVSGLSRTDAVAAITGNPQRPLTLRFNRPVDKGSSSTNRTSSVPQRSGERAAAIDSVVSDLIQSIEAQVTASVSRSSFVRPMDVASLARGVELLQGVFAAADVRGLHRVEHRVCAVLIREICRPIETLNISLILHQIGQLVEQEHVSPKSLDFRQFFQVFANQSDRDYLRLLQIDEGVVADLQALGQVFSDMDTNGSNSVDFNEFSVLCVASDGLSSQDSHQEDIERIWKMLAGRRTELSFCTFLEMFLNYRESRLGSVFVENVVKPARHDDPMHFTSVWRQRENDQQEEKDTNENWVHPDDVSDAGSYDASSRVVAPDRTPVLTALIGVDEYIEQASNPMSVRQAVEVLRLAFDGCDLKRLGSLHGDLIAFLLSIFVPEWTTKVVMARMNGLDIGSTSPNASGAISTMDPLGVTFDEMLHILVSPRPGELEVERRLGQADYSEEALAVASAATMFSMMDSDGNGTLDFTEFQAFVLASESSMSDGEISVVWDGFDAGWGGQVSLLGMIKGLVQKGIIGSAVSPDRACARFRQEVLTNYRPPAPTGAKQTAFAVSARSESGAFANMGGRLRGWQARTMSGASHKRIQVNMGKLCEQAFRAVATQTSAVATVDIRRLLTVVYCMSDLPTAIRARQNVENMPDLPDELDLRQFLALAMEVDIPTDCAQQGCNLVVAVANIFATVVKGSVDGEISQTQLAALAQFHGKKKMGNWAFDTLWPILDRWDCGVLTMDQFLQSAADVSGTDGDKMHKWLISRYIDIHTSDAAALARDAAKFASAAEQDDAATAAQASILLDAYTHTAGDSHGLEEERDPAQDFVAAYDMLVRDGLDDDG
jgi:hypothetical protein